MTTKLRRFVSYVLALALLISCFSGCKSENAAPEEIQIDTGSIVEEISDAIQDEGSTFSTDDPEPEPADLPPAVPTITYELSDHLGNLDTLVYGLIVSEYEKCYRVFDAAIELPDGEKVYGIGYTDFSDFYEADDGCGFFPAGFIRLIGEPEIPEEYIDTGLEIQDIDNETQYSFVLAYDTEPNLQHCVVWNQYLKYGIDSNSGITYSYTPYVRGECDESLGSLYSYDSQSYVFDTDFGKYKYLHGVSLSEQIDFQALEDEINRTIEEQNANFSSADVNTAVYFAQEAVCSYLMNLQEETFLGYSVAELVEKAKSLDPKECIRLSPNGTIVLTIEEEIPEGTDKTAKWLVGMACGIVLAGSIALQIFVPALAPVSAALSGAAVEVFMQVVVQNQAVDNIKWSKVAVASASGALLAWACPFAASSVAENVVQSVGSETVTIMGKEIATEALSKLSGYATLTFCNAMVSGATSTAMAKLDGASNEDSMDAFVWGAAIGGACTVFASALSEVGNAAMNALAKSKPNNWLINTLEKMSTFIGEHQVHLPNKQLENILAPKSVYEAATCAMNEIRSQKVHSQILTEEIKQITADNNKNFVKYDTKSNVISKAEMLEKGANCIIKLSPDCDPELQALFDKWGISEIIVKDGIPDFSTISEFSFVPKNGIGSNRNENMRNYYDQLANSWGKNPDAIPMRVRQFLTDEQVLNLSGKMVQDALSSAGLTLHEGVDGVVYAVERMIHTKISHYGGVALSNAWESVQMGKTYIKELLNSTVAAVWGTIVAEEAA